MHVCMYLFIYVCIYVCIYFHAHLHTHTHTPTHTHQPHITRTQRLQGAVAKEAVCHFKGLESKAVRCDSLNQIIGQVSVAAHV